MSAICEAVPPTGTGVSEYGRRVTWAALVPTVGPMQLQVSLTKRRAVDLCRVATCLCRMP